MLDYLIVFASSLLAATIAPFYSEVVLAAVLTRQPDAVLLLWALASVGNTLGSVVNWWLGKYLLHYKHKRWFPINDKQLDRAQCWFQRFGVWSLLLAWAPVGGDALTFIAGIMKVRLLPFVLLVFIGKSVRYLIVIYFAERFLF
ncbi:membrane protein YqaA with SNARE-associated domain [Oceanisphaera litoralis]|uniref:YqaA family protein n=1 Tax=Oceanisphaera litoralis TaxID=225144 RepID=UPI00195C9F89|nr:YqaA family protein [Oceanisphaera litoralis]MBM7455255.1 membrane protein YqaA with SNARE-associated domain [Oceanisphaera litoralis]